MSRKYITIERLKRLEDSIGFLSEYVPPKDEVHHVGTNINSESVKETKLLNELGRINVRRREIIKELMES